MFRCMAPPSQTTASIEHICTCNRIGLALPKPNVCSSIEYYSIILLTCFRHVSIILKTQLNVELQLVTNICLMNYEARVIDYRQGHHMPLSLSWSHDSYLISLHHAFKKPNCISLNLYIFIAASTST